MISAIKKITREYKVQLSDNEFSSCFVKSLYYFFNTIQLLGTITGHVRIFMYALGVKDGFKAVVTSWISATLIISVIANSSYYNNNFVIAFNVFRIYEIFIINFWMFIFRQSATTAYNENKEDNIRLLLLLIVQYVTVIFCFAGLYQWLQSLNSNSFTLGVLSYFDSVYYSFTSITTMGFSNFYPSTFVTKLLYCVEVSIGLFFILLFITAILNKINFHWKDRS